MSEACAYIERQQFLQHPSHHLRRLPEDGTLGGLIFTGVVGSLPCAMSGFRSEGVQVNEREGCKGENIAHTMLAEVGVCMTFLPFSLTCLTNLLSVKVVAVIAGILVGRLLAGLLVKPV